MKATVSIIGVSGFSGLELAQLVAAHPSLELVSAVADRWKGEPLGRRIPALRGRAARLQVRPMTEVLDAAAVASFAFLATPADVSAKLAPELVARGVRVVDLSGAFRLEDPAAYPRWYAFEHPAPELLREARFGLPELPATAGDAPGYDTCRLVANPGCYATSAMVALAPLVARGLVRPRVFIDGKSGVTGAGRKVEERLLFTEVDENLSAYRVGAHQHTPEIEQALRRIAGRAVEVTFTPHLLPVRRGLMTTCFAELAEGADPAAVAAAFDATYAGAETVFVTPPADVTLAAVTRTPNALVGSHADAERRSVVAIAALDNLLKGAASQALQNLCRMAGVPFSPAAEGG